MLPKARLSLQGSVKPLILYSMDSSVLETKTFMTKVYGWMSLGLLVTTDVVIFSASNAKIIDIVFGNPFLFSGLIILQLGLVVVLSGSKKFQQIQHCFYFYFFFAFLDAEDNTDLLTISPFSLYCRPYQKIRR